MGFECALTHLTVHGAPVKRPEYTAAVGDTSSGTPAFPLKSASDANDRLVIAHTITTYLWSFYAGKGTTACSLLTPHSAAAALAAFRRSDPSLRTCAAAVHYTWELSRSDPTRLLSLSVVSIHVSGNAATGVAIATEQIGTNPATSHRSTPFSLEKRDGRWLISLKNLPTS
jgi:hypothetical protein